MCAEKEEKCNINYALAPLVPKDFHFLAVLALKDVRFLVSLVPKDFHFLAPLVPKEFHFLAPLEHKDFHFLAPALRSRAGLTHENLCPLSRNGKKGSDGKRRERQKQNDGNA